VTYSLPRLEARRGRIATGRSSQDELEKLIEHINASAVFVGPSGIGSWLNRAMRAFPNEFAERQCPLIPVLLPGADAPALPRFLRGLGGVDLGKQDKAGIDRIV
jgi:hypothetical protein